MLARPIFRNLKTLPPRKNLFIYDYERLDPANPHIVQGDEVTPEPSHTRFGFRTILAILYLMAGTGAYAVTRLMYDYEWDRHYHINYPATLEYFDVFSKYYITKIQQLNQNLPGSLRELLPRVNTIPTARRSSQIPKTQVEQMLQTEQEIGDSFVALFEKTAPSKKSP